MPRQGERQRDSAGVLYQWSTNRGWRRVYEEEPRVEVEEPRVEVEDESMAIAIVVYGEIWCVCATRQEVDAALDGLRQHNRWWRDHKDGVTTQSTNAQPTSPYERLWYVQWVPGRAGWDNQPLGRHRTDLTEQVLENSDRQQTAYVQAPTAVLAQYRAQFLFMEKGKTR